MDFSGLDRTLQIEGNELLLTDVSPQNLWLLLESRKVAVWVLFYFCCTYLASQRLFLNIYFVIMPLQMIHNKLYLSFKLQNLMSQKSDI